MKVQTTEDAIRIELRLPVSQKEAWNLLTERRHVAQWWGEHVTLEAKPGGRFVERWSDGGRKVVTSGEVTQYRPPSTFEMTWADDGWPAATTVAFHLTASGNATRLVLEHSGWHLHPDRTRRSLIDAHAAGWSQYMEALADHAREHSDAE
jgi:uncharacterized protein YndB with AHSA1/START domain